MLRPENYTKEAKSLNGGIEGDNDGLISLKYRSQIKQNSEVSVVTAHFVLASFM